MAKLKRIIGILDGDLNCITKNPIRNFNSPEYLWPCDEDLFGKHKISVKKSMGRLLKMSCRFFQDFFLPRYFFCNGVDLINDRDVLWGLERNRAIFFPSVIEIDNEKISFRIEPVFVRRDKIICLPWASAGDKMNCLFFECVDNQDNQFLSFPDISLEYFFGIIQPLAEGYREIFPELCRGEYPFMATPPLEGDYYVRIIDWGERKISELASLLEPMVCEEPEKRGDDLVAQISGMSPIKILSMLRNAGIKEDKIVLIRFWEQEGEGMREAIDKEMIFKVNRAIKSEKLDFVLQFVLEKVLSLNNARLFNVKMIFRVEGMKENMNFKGKLEERGGNIYMMIATLGELVELVEDDRFIFFGRRK